MDVEFDKENITDGLDMKRAAPSPKKAPKKTRSSIGPGVLSEGRSVPLKEDAGNRRKSAFPAVKSILPSGDDAEKEKRRAERRKSLAARRVSFAPEATLHTWDVVEYMRDATTSSSASSEASRRASSMSDLSNAQSPQGASPAPAEPEIVEPPSTPPEQVEEPQPGSSPANQRDLHQKKLRRRSSGIPPMNFNNPDDAYSSSAEGSSSPIAESPGSDSTASPGGITVMEEEDLTMDAGDATGQSIASAGSAESTSSSVRLDQSLRKAAMLVDEQAKGEVENKVIQASFKPWVQRKPRDSIGVQKLAQMQQENVNPFSPAFKAQVSSQRQETAKDNEETQDMDMSMDMTRAVGGIVRQQQDTHLQQDQDKENALPMRSLKRRRSSTNGGLSTDATGSPAKRQSRRSSVRRRSSAEDSMLDDETMDLTMAVGGIQQVYSNDESRRESIDTSFGDETMDFTMVQGGIIGGVQFQDNDELAPEEDMSMELTATIDRTIKVSSTLQVPQSPAKSNKSAKPKSPAKSPRNSRKATAKSPLRQVQSADEIKTPSPTKTPTKSPRRSTRQSLLPSQSDEVVYPVLDTVDELPAPKLIDFDAAPQVPARESSPKVVLATPPRQTAPKSAGVPAFSPMKEFAAPKTTSLSESIRLLSTPRKQIPTSPVKKVAVTPKQNASPKKSASPKKMRTPRRSASPRKRVRMEVVEQDEPVEVLDENQEDLSTVSVEHIELQDFLKMTNIRFMELTTTKRRHTGHPGMDGKFLHEMEDPADDEEPSLESSVAAAVGTEPQLHMYHHACQEMKNYTAGGREDMQTLEEEVYENQPPLFREYLLAPPQERAIMDNQFKNMKTNARLQSKGGWYAWRRKLLSDLHKGQLQFASDFDRDEAVLTKQEAAIDAVLPNLIQQHEELEIESNRLQQRADELASHDREELETARENLVSTEAEIEEKKQMLANLQRQLEDKEANIEAVKERKVETLEEIKEAERVREEFRGWSSSEVSVLKAKVDELESEHGWSVTAASASPSTLTFTYLNDLELFFHPSSFKPTSGGENAPISLSYVGAESRSSNKTPRPLTTTKRFFLQLLRAQLHCIPQCQTTVASVLKTISSGWKHALAVSEAVRLLDQTCMTEELILSDERMAVDAMLLLPTLQTKVRVRVEIAAGIEHESIETQVRVVAKVMYGEKYDEAKMGEFLSKFTGGWVGEREEMGKWVEGVEDLRKRLIQRGKKG
ncbi:Spc7-domain-containing protein [Venturia nashicola]|nr:Spc7-domain-containing protein [Venturia nashicola]